MKDAPTVAIVRSDNRRGAIAEALALVGESLTAPLPAESWILPDFLSARNPWAWTQAATLSATVDAVLSWGSVRSQVIVPSEPVLETARLRLETWGRPVTYQVSQPGDPSCWRELEFQPVDSKPRMIRLLPQCGTSAGLISLATMKTSGTATVALTLANLLGLLHPEDRAELDPDEQAVGRHQGIANQRIQQNARRFWGAFDARPGLIPRGEQRWARILANRGERQSFQILAEVAGIVRPAVSVVDGFVAMDHDGPHFGKANRLGVVIAGNDPVAVDAAAAFIMGFDPSAVLSLAQASVAGVGQVDLGKVHLVGDPIDAVRGKFIPHSNQDSNPPRDRPPELSTKVRGASIVPAPHARPVRVHQIPRRSPSPKDLG